MIAHDILIQDIDVNGWANLASLVDRNTLRLLAGKHEKEISNHKRLFIVYEFNQALKAYHSEKGSILENFKWSGPRDLESIAHREGVDRIGAIEKGALERIYTQFQRRFNMREDYVGQLLGIYDAFRAELDQGIHFFPQRKFIRVDYDNIQRIFKFAVREDSVILFYLFEENKVWASCIIGVGKQDVNLFTSHDALAAQGIGIYNWRNDYKKILHAAERKFGKPSIGFFADVRAYARLLLSKKTLKTLNEERKEKNIILEPLPMLVKTALSAGKFFI